MNRADFVMNRGIVQPPPPRGKRRVAGPGAPAAG
jgi:hypothetical protein